MEPSKKAQIRAPGGGLGIGADAGGPFADRSSGARHCETAAAAGSGASLRLCCAVRFSRVRGGLAKAADHPEDESTGKPL